MFHHEHTNIDTYYVFFYFWQLFMKIKSVKAFTLIEILVGISIISIMALGISQMNFSRLSDNQKLDIELSKITSIIEETRNNALIGRWLGTNLVNPDSWNIQISNNSSSGTINVLYNSWGARVNYKSYSVQKPFSIIEISCKNVDWNSTGTSSNVLLWYTWANAGVDLWCSSDSSILDIQVWNSRLNKDIHIETITNIIEVK